MKNYSFLHRSVLQHITLVFFLALALTLASCTSDKEGDKKDPSVVLSIEGISIVTQEDTPFEAKFLLTKPEGKTLNCSITREPEKGIVTIISEYPTKVRYEPHVNISGDDSFEVTVSDGDTSVVGLAVVTIEPVNDAPEIEELAITGPEDNPLAGQVLATDAEEDALTYALVSDGEKGTATLDADTGSLLYTPNQDANGEDAIRYTVSDGEAPAVEGTVQITITPVNDVPSSGNAVFSTHEDGRLYRKPLIANDVDGDELSYEIVSGPYFGRASIYKGNLSYTPNHNAYGTDTLNYVVRDQESTSEIATIVINVESVNDRPIAYGRSFSIIDGEASGALYATDVETTKLTYLVAEGPSHGTLTLDSSSGTFTYTESPNEAVQDSFRFKVNDGEIDSWSVAIILKKPQDPGTVYTKRQTSTYDYPSRYPTRKIRRSIAVQSDNKFLVPMDDERNRRAYILRYYPDGTPDPSYGVNGSVYLPGVMGYRSGITSATMLPGDGLVVLGYQRVDFDASFCENYADHRQVFIAVDSAGSHQPTKVIQGMGPLTKPFVQPSGRILARQYRHCSGVAPFVVALNPQGEVDGDFPDISTSLDASYRPTDFSGLSDGSFLVSGITDSDELFIAKFSPGGDLDTSYGVNGIVVSTPNYPKVHARSDQALVPLSDGSVLLNAHINMMTRVAVCAQWEYYCPAMRCGPTGYRRRCVRYSYNDVVDSTRKSWLAKFDSTGQQDEEFGVLVDEFVSHAFLTPDYDDRLLVSSGNRIKRYSMLEKAFDDSLSISLPIPRGGTQRQAVENVTVLPDKKIFVLDSMYFTLFWP